jgi:hypothetical protein
MHRSSSKHVPLFLSSHFILISFLILPNTFCHAQLVPEWLVTGNSHFTGMETATGIAACEGGFYLTGGRIQNDFLLQVSDDKGLNWQRTLTLKQNGWGEIQAPLHRPFAEVYINSVSRPTPTMCFAYGSGSLEWGEGRYPFLLRSNDSGRTWTSVPLADSARGIWLSCLAMKDAMHGIRKGGYVDQDHSVLYRTSDGGDTWETIDIPFVDYKTKWIAYAKDGTLFVTQMGSKTLYRSKDNGDTWEQRGEMPSGRTPSFSSAHVGWLAYGVETGSGDTERDVIAKTIDGGISWQTVHDSLQDPPFGLTAISCANERNVIAVGRIGKLLHSNDGGLNWETAPRPFYLYDPALAEVTHADSASAVAGALFHLVTYTGGRTLPPPEVTFTQGPGSLQCTAHWSTVDGAIEYQLELAEDMPSNSLKYEIFDEHPYEQSGWIAGTSVELDPWLKLNRDYFIRVRARSGEHTSDWCHPVKFRTSSSTGVDHTPAAESMKISLFPQPAHTEINMHVTGLTHDAAWRLRLHDVLGRIVFAMRGTSGADGEVRHSLSTNGLPGGLLFVLFECQGVQRMVPVRVMN